MRKERMTENEYTEAKQEIEKIKAEIERLRATDFSVALGFLLYRYYIYYFNFAKTSLAFVTMSFAMVGAYGEVLAS